MFDWGVLKRGVPESVRFCFGDIPMYTFLVPTHPYCADIPPINAWAGIHKIDQVKPNISCIDSFTELDYQSRKYLWNAVLHRGTFSKDFLHGKYYPDLSQKVISLCIIFFQKSDNFFYFI